MRSCFRRSKAARTRCAGFTLLEVFTTLVVLLLALTALMQFMDSIDQSWRTAASDPFAEAASAFAIVTQHLEVATLDPYRDYVDATGAFRSSPTAAFTPYQLARRSDLDFVCGPGSALLGSTGRTTAGDGVFFAGPAGQTQLYAETGLDHLFNALGYFVEFGPDTNGPSFLGASARSRWRLKQIVQPSESLQIFSSSTSAPWITQLASSTATPSILAENVIALVVLPERPPGDATLAPAYNYDSRDTTNALTFAQLPARVRVVLAAIDEASAQRLASASGSAAPALLPAGVFQNAANLNADITALDASLTTAKIGHRIFQRDLAVTTAAWSNTP
jgi:uncharacterized protein (TIGR02599 family)